MNIVLKREARAFLETNKDSIEFLFIDGALTAEYVKACGCCGPPPSPDFQIEAFWSGDGKPRPDLEGTTNLANIVPFHVSNQLYNALSRARMTIVVFYLEVAGAPGGTGDLVAKFI
jgi:hypothetical protein